MPSSRDGTLLPLGQTSGVPRARVVIAGVAAAGSIVAAAANATLIFDDPYLVEHFRTLLDRRGLLETLWILFFNLDLLDLGPGAAQYRLYGLSRIFHFGLWGLFGVQAWAYAAVIGMTQAATGWGIYRLLRRLGTDAWQGAALAGVWILSPFAATSCFHHYSYLILPYQLTVACALALQATHDAEPRRAWRWRLLAGVLGFTVACTGEAHLLASVLVLTLVALGNPSSRLRSQRWVDAAVAVGAIVTTVALHRWAWSQLAGRYPETPRYVFGLPTIAEMYLRTVAYLTSLPRGMTAQVAAIVEFAGPWALLSTAIGAVVVGAGLWRFWRDAGNAAPAPHALPLALALVGLASVIVVWALSVFTGQVSVIFPRRYGYVPNTLAAMTAVALLAAPSVRWRLGMIPAVAVFIVPVWLWITLQAACLPLIRAQDERVWTAARAAMAGKQAPSVVFLNAWSSVDMPGYDLQVDTPGLRGPDVPPIFESPFSAFWWQSQYAVVVLGARFAADRAVAQDAGHVRLAGNGVNNKSPIVAPIDSVVVVADPGRVPPDWKASLDRIVVFPRWQDALAAGTAHAVTLTRGWDEPMNLGNVDGVAIALGQRGDRTLGAGVLPDKRWSDPALPSGPIANHGLEDGEDRVFAMLPLGPLAYFRSNRHGAFTYRIDFVDREGKIVALDLLELWHRRRGQRLMTVDAAFDDHWFNLATIDPFAEAGLTPLAIKFPVSGVRTIRVRLSPAPGTADIPFLNGIRVLRSAPGRP